mmetsp:Transcript_141244/g.438938  ORF Transcript_141244/g.438938 Transcript_141244/m.438938 type:complete len:353 (-) Transcript_141244:34-1092(-)
MWHWLVLALTQVATPVASLLLTSSAGADGPARWPAENRRPPKLRAPRSHRRNLTFTETQDLVGIVFWLRRGASARSSPRSLPKDVAQAFAQAPWPVSEVLDRWSSLDWRPYASIQRVEAFGQNFTVISNDRTPDFESLRDYELLTNRVPPGGLALDVGGHVGRVAVLLAKLNPGARVVTFEPSEFNRFFLELNLALNGIPFKPSGGVALSSGPNATSTGPAIVEVRAEALAGSTGMQDFAFEPESADTSHLDPKHRSLYERLERVDTVTLEDALQRIGAGAVDLLKMDCEGCEYEVLSRLAPETLGRLRHVCAEVHHDFDNEEVNQHETRLLNEVACSRGWDMRFLGHRMEC